MEGSSSEHVEARTGVKLCMHAYFRRRAKESGFEPEGDPRIQEYYVQDGKRSGRPKAVTEEKEEQLNN